MPRLSRRLIVDLAVTVADAEGVAAVSMGRLGRDLGVTTMSLYRYVDSKQELLEAMAERVLEDLHLLSVVAPGEGWQDVARRVVYAWADLVARHPGAIRLIYTDRPATLTDMLPAELFVTAALGAGFSPALAALAYRTIVLFVDSVLLTTSIRGDAGTSDWALLPEHLSQALPGVRAIALHADQLTYRQIFENGVELVIEGIARQAAAERRRATTVGSTSR